MERGYLGVKKNWMQIATLCLCAVLLGVTVEQSLQISALQRRMEHEMSDLRSEVSHEISNISSRIARELEEANRVVAKYTLEPKGIDKETRSLKAEASVTLKEWREDTQIVLLAKIGEEECTLPMTTDGNGTYFGERSLPLEGDAGIYLDALVTGSGLTKKETLSVGSEISMLLPLRYSGGGWSGPEYGGGVMSSQFDIVIEGQNGKPKPNSIRNPQFLTYRNGELVQTQNAVEDPHSVAGNGFCYTVDTENNEWFVECTTGDVIEIRFRCEDEYGLGYDFLFQTWNADGDFSESPAGAGMHDSSTPLILYWPE